MTFGPNHYVPVLKVKRGEKAALRQIASGVRTRITPLLEIVERRPEKSITAHLATSFRDLAASVTGYPRCFLDLREIESDGTHAADEVFRYAAATGLAFTPVTGISRSADLAAALNHKKRGLALRLTRSEFESGGLTAKIKSFIAHHKLSPTQVDLIVDVGAVENMISLGVSTLTNDFLAAVPHHNSWRTLTVSASAFPVSMGGVIRHSHDFAERVDWIAWRDNLHGRRAALTRLPTFSDCAIQHPRGVEGFDPRTMQVPAAIRYTRNDNWLLLKGESTRTTPPSVQFPDLAVRLVYGVLKNCYLGPQHCVGCASIKDAADGAPGYGSAEAWRRLGTIHHLSHVMMGLGSLPWT